MSGPRPQRGIRNRGLVVWSILLGSICLSYLGSAVLKFGFHSSLWPGWLATALPFTLGVKILTLKLFGVDRGMWRYAGVRDLLSTAGSAISASGLLAVLALLAGLPRSIWSLLIIDLLIWFLILASARMTLRVWNEMRPSGSTPRRALIIGAGDAGEATVRVLMRERRSEFIPVGLVDDDPLKHGLLIHGITVEGDIAELPEIAARRRAEVLIVAIGRRIGSERMSEILRAAYATRLPVKRIPDLADMLRGEAMIGDIRDFGMEDLLQREPIRTDRAKVAELITGRRVLVTGGAGSIGSELCRQIQSHDPDLLVVFDSNENALHDISCELRAVGIAAELVPILGNVRDRSKLAEIFADLRPEVVFHAAAYKHVPVLESFPDEAVLNNVRGTQNVAELAHENGCAQFVFISTDKAVRPTSVMGATKRIAELVVADLGSRSSTSFSTIRFGNVLGSNGSVVQTFRRQIAHGGPVTVTHPEIRRYFMSIPEAVGLVLFAAAMDEKGRTYILEMGEQVRIIDLAHHFIRLCGFEPERDIPIEIVGLRPGEKLYEELWVEEERPSPTSHPGILSAERPDLDRADLAPQIASLLDAAESGDHPRILAELRQLVPGFEPSTATKPELLVDTSAKEGVDQS